MQWRIGRASSWVVVCCACAVLGATAPAGGQGQSDQATEPNQHLLLPPVFGGTPLSYQIQAEASYVAAYGDMVESIATARKINAQAVALEIQNSVAYVDAYFKRRELNRQWRAKENPNYLESEKKRQVVLKRRVEEQYQDLLRGDVTKTLNWLLRELAGPMVASRYLPPEQSLAHTQLDQTLTSRDLEQIRLTDGGGSASRLVFAAADGKVLQTAWPLGLRGPECAAARETFEHTRDGVINEIHEKGQASHESQTKLLQDVNGLFVALENAYPKQRRQNPSEFLTYGAAKRFLQSTLAASHRAITTTDPRVLGGGLRFQGDSVVGLLEHMYQGGLEFAPPEPGGEGVYANLFQNMRTLYTKIGSEQPPSEPLKRAAPAPPTPNDKEKPGGNQG